MIRDILVIIILISILITVIKVQIVLSKKDKKILGLIIPIFIFMFSLFLTVGATPVKPEIETTQMITTEKVDVLEDSLVTPISASLVEKSFIMNSFLYTILIINTGNLILLGIYFYCRHQKKIRVE